MKKMKSSGFVRRPLVNSVAATLITVLAGVAQANNEKFKVDIPAQGASSALIQLANAAGVQVSMGEGVGNAIQVRSLKGEYSLADALGQILEGSGLVYNITKDGMVLIEKDDEADAVKVDTEKDVEEVVVTGSRVARTTSQLAANVITLDAEDLRATGQNTLEGALRQLPQNIYGASEVGATLAVTGMSFNGALNITGGSSINLRGLGSESTLVLIDGRRIGKSGLFGGASDISAIPLRSVERVELMLDGASAIYGSDAVGGVVNIILKKDYDDIEATYEYGEPDAGGFGEHALTLSGGIHWGSGRARATFEHFQRSNLDGAERPERIYRTYFRSPALIRAFPAFYQYNGQNYLQSELAAEGLTPSVEGVERVIFTQLPADWSGTGGVSLDDLSNAADLSYDLDASDGISLIPAQERSTFQVGFEQELGESVTLSGSAYYSDRKTHAANGSFIFNAYFHQDDTPLPIETFTNVSWRVPGLAEKHFESDQKVTRWHLALDGNVGEDWRWQVAAGQSRDQIDSLYIGNAIGTTYYSDAMLDYYRSLPWYTEEDIAAFDYRFTELVDAGLDVFTNDLYATNDFSLLAQLVETQPQAVYALNRENTFEMSANGSLFALPSGDVHLAVGAGWREEKLKTRSELPVNQRGNPGFSGSVPMGSYDNTGASRTVRSVFTEALLPLVGSGNAVTGVEQLSLTGAARYDSYNHFRSDSTWSLGVIWSPNDQFRFKANKSTSYVVPTPRDALIDPVETDYNGGNMWPAPIIDQNGDYTGEYETGGLYITGGNSDLEPETASTVTAGVEVTPESVPGLSLNATWHQTVYSNRIGVPPTPEFIEGTDYVSKYQTLTRTEGGLLNWDNRAINYAKVEVAGVDYRLRYNRDTDIGEFIITANIGYTGKYDRTEIVGEKPVNEVADVGFQSRSVIPAYRYSANLGWYHRGLAINLDASTMSKTVSTAEVSGEVIQRRGEAALATDLLFSYNFEEGDLFTSPAWLNKTSVSLKVLNVLDDHPEYQVKNLTTGEPHDEPELNANLADPRGRMFYLSISRRF